MIENEIEIRFLEVDQEAIKAKLLKIGAKDLGEKFISEVIFYDRERKWLTELRRYIRIRTIDGESIVTYKQSSGDTSKGCEEISFPIEESAIPAFTALLEKIGIDRVRDQEKRRHTFVLGEYIYDIDTWPKIPTYIEIEARSEGDLKKASELVGFSWEKREVHDAKWVIEEIYKIPLGTLRWFTFEKCE